MASRAGTYNGFFRMIRYALLNLLTYQLQNGFTIKPITKLLNALASNSYATFEVKIMTYNSITDNLHCNDTDAYIITFKGKKRLVRPAACSSRGTFHIYVSYISFI